MPRILRALALVPALVALASCGDSSLMSPLTPGGPPSFTTGAAFPAPAGFVVEGPPLTGGPVTMSWEDLPGDQLYLIQWRKGETGTWKSLVSTGANRTAYSTDSLAATQPNYYRIAGMTPDFRVGEFTMLLLKPSAYTREGALTSDSTATLNTYLRPNGSTITWWFEYGTDSTLAGAAQTVAQQLEPVAYGTLHPASQSIPVVTGNVYYFRSAASNAGGTSYGAIHHLNAGPPAAPTGVTAAFVLQPEDTGLNTNTAAHHVNVQWTHDGVDVSRFLPQRRLVGSPNWVQVADVGGGGRRYVDEGFPVSSDREYDYRVLACNRIGQCSASAELRVATKGLPAPAGFTATRTADGKVALAWQDLATEESYLVQWRAGETGNWQTLVSTGPNVKAYTTGSVTAGVTNYYRVAGEVKSFRDGAFAEASVAAGGGSSTQVQTGGFTLPSSTSAVLKGTVTPNGLATTAWIEYGTDPALATFTAAPAKPVGSGTAAVAFTDSVAVTSGQTYYYRAAASNSAGTVRGSIQSFLAGPPAAPSLSAAFSLANYRITASWTYSGSGSGDAILFRVERRTTGGTTWTEVSQSRSNPGTFIDTNFPVNAVRSYEYRVRACNAANECTPSSLAPVQTQVLPAPGGLAAQAASGKVTLTWQDISGEVAYLVQWRTDPAGAWKTLLSTGANVTSYTASATPGVTNYYRVAGQVEGFRVGVYSETSIAVP
jgi:hypothetical protein